nr:hypothetical protein [Tanacetum cinerariifolium]
MDEALVPSAQRCPFFKAFLVTADVPEIYMQEFWATATIHYHAIRFKMDNKKHIVNLESFRDMLHIFSRVHGQTFNEPPFEKEILNFIRFLGHSATIRMLADVNINKLYQPWRSFTAIINKCLTEKSSGYDSLILSQNKFLWGLYHKRNIDYAYLLWEDFVNQVKHKKTKKSNEMYYPRFTKVIIHHFMSKDPSISRRNKVYWHYPMNEEIKNSSAYKEYYAIATGEAVPKPKASVRRTRSSFDTYINPPTATASPRLTSITKGKQTAKASKAKSLSALSEPSGSGTDEGTGSRPGVPNVPTDESEEELSWNSTDDEGADDEGKDDNDDEEDVENKMDEESFDPISQTPKSSEDKGDGEEDQDLTIGEEERLNEEEEADKLYRYVNINQGRGIQVTQEVKDSHVTLTLVNPDGMESLFENASTSVAPLPITAPTMTSSTISITTTSQAPNLPTTENDEFLRSVDENMKKIIKEHVKEQVKVQVSKILPRIEQAMNEQLEAKVLTRSSHSSRSSYAVAADLSEMELKKILIEKMEGNKSIQCSDEQRDLYKALVDAYESDKIILDTYEETVTLKRRCDDDADKDKEPSAGLDRGSKRCKEGKEPESASAPTKTTTKSAGRSTTGSRSRQASASESDLVEEPMQTTSQMDEPSHPEFDTGADDQPIVQSSQHPEWYLRGGTSSWKYTTSVTKMKAADYGHIKWIEDVMMINSTSLKKAILKGYDVYKKHRHSATCGRPSAGSQKLPEEA